MLEIKSGWLEGLFYFQERLRFGWTRAPLQFGIMNMWTPPTPRSEPNIDPTGAPSGLQRDSVPIMLRPILASRGPARSMLGVLCAANARRGFTTGAMASEEQPSLAHEDSPKPPADSQSYRRNSHRLSTMDLEDQPAQITPQFYTYREQLYTCRTVRLYSNGVPAQGFAELRRNMNDERLHERVKAKRRFKRPCIVKRENAFKEREEKYNEVVKAHIGTILKAHRDWDQGAEGG